MFDVGITSNQGCVYQKGKGRERRMVSPLDEGDQKEGGQWSCVVLVARRIITDGIWSDGMMERLDAEAEGEKPGT
jgi:hypothetical protein